MNVGTLTILLGVTTSGVNKAIRDVNRLERNVATSVTAINAHMLNFSRTMLQFATFPTVVLGAVGTKAFSDFEYNLHKVTGLIGIAEDQTKSWGQEILKLAPAYGASAKKMSEALYFIASANPQREATQQMEILKASTKAAEAGLGDVATVADVVTSAMNAYGSENQSAVKTVDELIFGIREGKVEADAFASSLGRLLPPAQKVGLKFNELVATTAALSRTGNNAAEAVTQIRRMLFTLVQQPEKGNKALGELNNSYNNLISTLRNKGMLDLLMEIKNMAEFRGEDFLADIFPNIRALIPVIDLLGENFEENVGIFKRSGEVTNELDKLWKNYTKTVRYAIKQTFAQAGVTAIEFGNQIKTVVISVLGQLIKMLSNVITWFTSLDSRTKELIVQITLFAAAFGPLYLIFSSLITIILSVIKTALIPFRLALGLVTGALKILVGGLKGLKEVMVSLKAVVLTNPFTLLAASLLAVGYAFTKIQNTSYAWYMFMSGAFTKMRIWFLQFEIWIFKHLEQPLLNTIKILNNVLPNKLQINTDWDLKDEIDENIKKISELEQELADNPFKDFKSAAGVTFGSMKDDFSGLTDWIVKKWDGLWGKMGMGDLSMPEGGFGPDESPIAETFDEFIKRVTDVKPVINDFIYDPFQKVDELLQNTWGGLVNLQVYAIKVGQGFDVAAESMKFLKSQIEAIDAEIMKSGGTKKQIEDVNKLRQEYSQLQLSKIWGEYLQQMDEVVFKTELLGNSYNSLEQKSRVYGQSIGEMLRMDVKLWENNEVALQNYINKLTELTKKQKEVQNQMRIQNTIAEGATDLLMTMGEAAAGVEGAYERMGQIVIGVIEDIIRALLKEIILEGLRKIGKEEVTNATARQNLKDMESLAIQTALTGVIATNSAMLGINTSQKISNTAATSANAVASTVNAAATSTEAVANAGGAVAGVTEEGAKQPFPLNIIAIALGVAAVIAALSQTSKARSAVRMAQGGIVPSGYPNDSYPAMLTSGETVVPPHKLPEFKGFEQKNLEIKLSGDWKIKGKDLYYVFSEEKRRIGNVF